MFELMNSHIFELETSASNYALLERGISNVGIGNNENLSQDQYLSGGGFGETDVIGAQLILTFTGHRDYTDAAQNYILGKLLNLGVSRRTTFRWTEPDGGVFTGSCTIANISPPSGDAGAKGEFSFEIHFNGQPSYTAGTGDTTPPTLTVSPIDAATAVAVTANVVWTFSEPIEAKSVSDSNFIVAKADGTLVAGSLALSAGGTVVTFDPTTNFTALTDYIATVTRNVRNTSGIPLASNNITNFRTA